MTLFLFGALLSSKSRVYQISLYLKLGKNFFLTLQVPPKIQLTQCCALATCVF